MVQDSTRHGYKITSTPGAKAHRRPRSASYLIGASLVALSLACSGTAALAGNTLPSGGQFAAGAGTISGASNGLVINQSTSHGIIDWQSFSIGQGKYVHIDNGAGATLNRVTGGNLSSIAGSLTSTGSVYVINPAGIIVMPGGNIVTTGSFVASTRDVPNSAFMAGGTEQLGGSSTGAVVNQGSITSANGDVTLVGKSVTNNGQINAPNGSANLAAGDNLLLQPGGSQAVLINAGSGDVTNTGTVAAAQVSLDAAGGNVYALATNNGGVIRATGTATRDGHVYLTAGGNVTVDGSVSATNANGSGGAITATGGATSGNLSVAGTVNASASGASAAGGRVTLTAASVNLGTTANVSANGGSTGGTVFVGGDRHGGTDRAIALSSTPIANARQTSIAAGAQISANGGAGGGAGQGGDVIVWSDQSTSYAGQIAAQGGQKGGNGGFVEVSGEQLAFTGKVSTLARLGKEGQLLLDPSDVDIVAAPGTTTNESSSTSGETTTYAPNGTGPAVSTLLNTDVEAALATTNVTITTSNAGGTGTGNIILSTSIDWDMGANPGNHSLTLNAAGTIVFASGTTAAIETGGAGNITLMAAGAGVVSGGTVIQVGGPISANGGTISLLSTTPDYRIVVSNGVTVSNTQAMGSGEVILQADRVRLGNLTNPQGFVTTPGNVVVEPTSTGPVQIGNNNTLTGSSTSFTNNTTLINQESIANITANTLAIGSANTTGIELTTPATNPTSISATGVQNLELLTAPTGTVTQDGNTPLSVGASGSGALAISTGAIDLPLANSAGAVAFQAQGNVVFQGQSAPGAGGTLQIGAVGGGPIAGISGITTTGGSTVTLVASGTVTQDTDAGNTINAQNLVLEGGGSFNLNNTANAVTDVAGSVGSLSLYDNTPLTVASLSDNQPVPATVNGLSGAGAIALVDNGVLTIAKGAPVTDNGGNVQLETAVAFVNQDGNSAFNVSGGTWRVYSQDPRNDTKGGLTSASYNFVQYGAANSYSDPFTTANAALNPAATGNGFLYTVSPTVSESLQGTFSKVYDGTTLVVPGLGSANYSGVSGTINGDDVRLSHPTIGNYDNKNVGAGKTITVNGIALVSAVDANGVPVYGYGVVTTDTTTGTITPALLTLTPATETKTYDGTTGASETPTVAGLVTGDSVTGLTESFTSPHVLGTNGSTLVVNPGFTVNDGNGGNNYTVVLDTTPGTIMAAALTISAVPDTKVYDGTTVSTLTPTFTGLQPGDTLTSLSQSYTSKNVLGTNGSTLVVNPNYVLSDPSDYAVTLVNAQGTITPALLTVTATPNTKTYDGTTSAAATPTITSGQLYGTDTGDFIEAYSGKNAGTGLTLTPSGTVTDGNGGNNYQVTFVPISAGIINKALLTISAVTDTKVYDGTTTSDKTPTETGLQTGDTLTNLSQAFTSPNVMGTNGSTLVVNPTYLLNDGNGGNNYTVRLVTAPGTITPLAVAVILHGTRAYDGTTDASSSILTITNDHDGSNLVLSGTGVLASRNVGDEQLLSQNGSLEGFTLGGSAAANYTLVGGSGDVVITPLPITVMAVANTKTFDGTTNAAGVPIITVGSLVGGDTGNFIETYNTIHAGTGLTLTPTGVVSDGNGGANYTVTFVPIAAGAIDPEALTISAVPDSKVYDGTTNSSGTPILATGTLYDGDTLSSLSQSFTSKNVLGTNGSTLVVNPNYVLTDASDYAVTLQSALGTITPALLTVSAVTNTKTYDGTTGAAGTPIITSGQLYGTDAGDFIETYSTKNAGTGLTLTPSGTVSDGNGGNNYTVTFVPVSTGTINTALLTISAVSDTKIYDGTTNSSLTPIITAGALVGGDTLTNLSQSFTAKDVLGTNGSTLVVNQNYVLTDASNYTVTLLTAPGTITPALLTVSAVPNTKTFDGTNGALGAPVITAGQVYGTDAGNFVETYGTVHAGTNLLITPSGTVNDGNGGKDYQITFVSIGGGGTNPVCGGCTINPEAITISAVTDTKTYDGTTNSSGVPILTAGALYDGDTLTSLSQSFGSKNVLGPNGSTLTVNTNYVLTDPSDYAVTLLPAQGTINPALLTVSAVPNTKTFDGTDSASATPIITSGQLYGTDTGSFTETYSTRNAGTGLTLTPSGTVADGNGGNNYTVTFVPISTGIINAEAITISAVPDTKVYDGTTISTGTPILTVGTLYNGDALSNLSQAFGSKDVLGTNGSTLIVNPGYVLTDASNYTVTLLTAPGTITPALLTVSAVPNSKTFDGTTSADGTPVITSGQLYGTDTGSFVETYNTIHAGTNLVLTPSGTVSDGNGGKDYQVTFVPLAAGTINAEAISISAVTDTKTYDGTTNSNGIPVLTAGMLYNGDTLTSLSQSFGSKNVLGPNGSTLTVNPTYVLTDPSDYAVTLLPAQGTINPALLTVSAVTNTKTYDGTTRAAGTPIITSGQLYGTDTGDFTETYSTKNAGTGLTLTPSGTVNDGNGGNNYTITFAPVSTGTITPEALTISAVSETKVYDGTTVSTGAPIITAGALVGGDTLTNLSQSFNSKDVLGTNASVLSVNPNYVLTDASNYTVTVLTAPGTITPALLTVTAVPDTKTYDGTTIATATPAITSGQLYGADTANFIETFSTKNAGTGLTLTPSGTVNDGNGGNDYQVTFAPVSTGTINPEAITISAVTDTKTYDGTVTSSLTPIITSGSLVGGDTLQDLTQSFNSKNVMGTNGSTLSVNAGYTLTDASDYTVTLATAPGTINPAAVTVSAVPTTKIYDGTDTSSGTPIITAGQLYGTDSGAFTQTYSTANAGTSLTLTPTGTISDGNGGKNYTVTYLPVVTGIIDPRPIVVTGTRVYDGGTDAGSTILGITNAVSGDTVDLTSGTGVLASRNVGTEALTSWGTLMLGGASAKNYTLFDGSGSVLVTPLPITVTAVGGTTVYSGTDTGPGTPVITSGHLVGGDTGTFTETYGSPNAGTGIAITPTGTIADGNGGDNYTVTYVGTTGTIDPRPVIITGTRPYDGGTDAPGGILVVTNNVSGSNLTISGEGTLAGAAVGDELILSFGSLELGGSAAGNYTLNGGKGTVLVTPIPSYVNIATRFDQTVAGIGLDPYVNINSMGGILLPEPGQSGLGACFIESWYVADDGRPRPICRWIGDGFRGEIQGPRGRLDTSGYLITSALAMPPDSIERSHALYQQMRNK